MDEHILRAERFLRAMALRGQRACEALELDDWQGFAEAIRWKKAAFHHFCAVDHILQQSMPNYLQGEVWQSLWRQIEDTDRKLRTQIEKNQSKLQKQLGKIRQNRATLGRFQSGNKDETGFIETV